MLPSLTVQKSYEALVKWVTDAKTNEELVKIENLTCPACETLGVACVRKNPPELKYQKGVGQTITPDRCELCALRGAKCGVQGCEMLILDESTDPKAKATGDYRFVNKKKFETVKRVKQTDLNSYNAYGMKTKSLRHLLEASGSWTEDDENKVLASKGDMEKPKDKKQRGKTKWVMRTLKSDTRPCKLNEEESNPSDQKPAKKRSEIASSSKSNQGKNKKREKGEDVEGEEEEEEEEEERGEEEEEDGEEEKEESVVVIYKGKGKAVRPRQASSTQEPMPFELGQNDEDTANAPDSFVEERYNSKPKTTSKSRARPTGSGSNVPSRSNPSRAAKAAQAVTSESRGIAKSKPNENPKSTGIVTSSRLGLRPIAITGSDEEGSAVLGVNDQPLEDVPEPQGAAGEGDALALSGSEVSGEIDLGAIVDRVKERLNAPIEVPTTTSAFEDVVFELLKLPSMTLAAVRDRDIAQKQLQRLEAESVSRKRKRDQNQADETSQDYDYRKRLRNEIADKQNAWEHEKTQLTIQHRNELRQFEDDLENEKRLSKRILTELNAERHKHGLKPMSIATFKSRSSAAPSSAAGSSSRII
ncbi:hypothetical protein V866_003178 [Kwoniella sp. B9012]